MFYLQPHVGGTESPITRTRKTYGLSAPRWITRMSFRGGYDGVPHLHEPGGFGPRLDSLIADLEGGLNIAVFHDWRRPRPSQKIAATGPILSTGAAAGASSMILTGFAPRSVAMSVGDYIGGDGRPHIVSAAKTVQFGGQILGAGSLMADPAGAVLVGFRPPLRSAIPAGTPMTWPVTGRFQLVGDDAGQNESTIGQLTEYTLDFVEELL